MKRTFYISLIFAVLALPGFAQKSETVTDADYAQITKFILSDLRLNKRSFLPEEEQKFIRLSIDNIKPSLIPNEVDGVKIKFRNAKQIEDDKKNNRRYYAFGQFKFEDSLIKVVLFYFYKNKESDPIAELSVGYEYFKINDNWKLLVKKPNVKVEKID